MSKKQLLIAALAAALSGTAGAVPRGIVAVRADTDVKALVEGVNRAFEQFKAEHTKQLEAVKAGLPASDITAKVEKIGVDLDAFQKALDEHSVKMASLEMGGVGGVKLRDAEYTDAFNAHVKRGDVSAALNKGADEQGGLSDADRMGSLDHQQARAALADASDVSGAIGFEGRLFEACQHERDGEWLGWRN